MAEAGEWANPRFLAEPWDDANEGEAMEGPRLLNRKTTTPAPTPRVRPSGCSTSAAILLYPHTCLRRRAKFEGVSVWGLSVRQQRSTTLEDGNTDPMPRSAEGMTRIVTAVGSCKGTTALSLSPAKAGSLNSPWANPLRPVRGAPIRQRPFERVCRI